MGKDDQNDNTFQTGLIVNSAENFDLSFIYKSYFKDLFNYGMQLIKDREVVKDCIQDIFVDLKKNEESRKINNIKLYLFKALKYSIFKNIKQERHFLHKEEAFYENYIELEGSHEDHLVSLQQATDQTKQLSLAFDHLTPRQREAVFLKYYENFDYDGIAALLALEDVKSARNLIYKGLQILRKHLVSSSNRTITTTSFILFSSILAFL